MGWERERGEQERERERARERNGRCPLVSLKKRNYFFPISFCHVQSHSWPGNAGHLCTPAAGLGRLCGRTDCLLGALHTDQYHRGTSSDKLHPASGELVLAGESGPPVNVSGISICTLLSSMGYFDLESETSF